jgi:Xaa-Pro aminopeptidase
MYSARLNTLRQRLETEGLDALLVTSLPNIYYLSGFTGSTAMLLVGRTQSFFLTDFRYHEQYKTEVDDSCELFDNTGKELAKVVLPAIAERIGLNTIGFESDNVTYSAFEKLSAFAAGRFVPTAGWIEDMRIRKTPEEVERVRAAIRVNETIFNEVLGVVVDGVTEADLAAEIEYRALKHGCSGVSFSPIVASGVNSCRPHARFSQQQLVPGTPLTFDMGMKLDGYCSDMTRTVFFKDCPPRWEQVYGIVREAKDSAAAAIRPGVQGREVDKVARDIITAAGHGEHFGHGLGHGIGIEVHEAPRLATVGERMLEAGNLVTNEPGIYLPGEGGIRIEDIFLVTDNGSENLNTLPTDIQVVG